MVERLKEEQKDSMNEKRQHNRYIVDDMEISGQMLFATEVKVINISISGISIKADRRLDIGKEYSLKLGETDNIFSLKGNVVWSSISETKKNSRGDLVPIYTAGLKFSNVITDRLMEIITFIEEHKKDQEHRLSGLRFSINVPGKAILKVPSNYKVVKISMGGMLIKSREPLDIESRFPMEISLPEDSPINFIGRVASCSLIEDDEPVGHYDIGIAFMEMPEKDGVRLKKFIDFLHKIGKKYLSI
jgi:hypothetical protein